jgi:hypothetical protein
VLSYRLGPTGSSGIPAGGALDGRPSSDASRVGAGTPLLSSDERSHDGRAGSACTRRRERRCRHR